MVLGGVVRHPALVLPERGPLFAGLLNREPTTTGCPVEMPENLGVAKVPHLDALILSSALCALLMALKSANSAMRFPRSKSGAFFSFVRL